MKKEERERRERGERGERGKLSPDCLSMDTKKEKHFITEITLAGRTLDQRVTALVVGRALCPWTMGRATRQTQMR